MRKIFMLLVACVAMAFVSCSKDDDNDVTKGVNGERLVSKITYSALYTENDGDYLTYEYDKQGRIIRWVQYDENGTVDYITTYSYGDKEIKVTEENIDLKYGNDTYTTTHILNDKGLIILTNEDNYTYTCTYNENNQLIRMQGEDFKITWKDGNIVKEEVNDRNQTYVYTYSYSNNENKTIGLNVMYSLGTLDDPLFHCGYFGSTNKNLVSSSDDGENSYEYEFDKDGYVTVMKGYKTENGKKVLEGIITVEYK